MKVSPVDGREVLSSSQLSCDLDEDFWPWQEISRATSSREQVALTVLDDDGIDLLLFGSKNSLPVFAPLAPIVYEVVECIGGV